MTTPVNIRGGSGSHKIATVTDRGELVVGPPATSLTVYRELAEDATAYNFYDPMQSKQFIITAIIAKADKQVSSTVDADFIVYEAEDATETTIVKTLFQMAMVQGDLIAITGLNILVSEGAFINAKTTDDDFHVNIMGYYVTI